MKKISRKIWDAVRQIPNMQILKTLLYVALGCILTLNGITVFTWSYWVIVAIIISVNLIPKGQIKQQTTEASEILDSDDSETEKIDALLDKINRGGVKSLSSRENEFLKSLPKAY